VSSVSAGDVSSVSAGDVSSPSAGDVVSPAVGRSAPAAAAERPPTVRAVARTIEAPEPMEFPSPRVRGTARPIVAPITQPPAAEHGRASATVPPAAADHARASAAVRPSRRIDPSVIEAVLSPDPRAVRESPPSTERGGAAIARSAAAEQRSFVVEPGVFARATSSSTPTPWIEPIQPGQSAEPAQHVQPTAPAATAPLVDPPASVDPAASIESTSSGRTDVAEPDDSPSADPREANRRALARLGASDIEWKAAAARAESNGVNAVPDHRWLAGTAEAGDQDADPRIVGGAAVDPATEGVPEKGFARRLILPVCVGLAAAFVAGIGYLAVTEPQTVRDLGRWGSVEDPAAATAAPQPSDFGAEDPTTNPFGAPPPVLTGPPTRLRISAIGVNTTLESLHLAKAGALTPPKNFAKAGWYADGTAPGDQGPAVIAGHVDSKRGPAVFYKLRELQAGDRIEVVRGGRTVRFTVVSAAWYPKTKFPTDRVYGPTPDRQLRLITCGGVFDHSLRSYKDNLVVYAVAG
jgi:hypothetical protein